MIQKIKLIIATTFTFSPFFAFAQQIRTLTDLINRFILILNALIPLIFGVALIGFLWGVSKFILNADDEKAREEGKKVMIYGIIGLFVMVAIWGIVLLLANTFGISLNSNVAIPRLPGGTEFIPFSPFPRTPGFEGLTPL